MGLQDNLKIQKDIEDLKKQIWLLTLKVKNLRESTNRIKRLLNSAEFPSTVNESGARAVGDKAHDTNDK